MLKNKDLAEALEAINTLEQRRNELEKDYKRKKDKMRAEISSVRNKLEAARTHAVMSVTPYLAKSLGLSDMLNITVDNIRNSNDLQNKLQNKKSFDEVFEDFTIAFTALGDYFYNHPELTAQLQEFIRKETTLKSTKHYADISEVQINESNT